MPALVISLHRECVQLVAKYPVVNYHCCWHGDFFADLFAKENRLVSTNEQDADAVFVEY